MTAVLAELRRMLLEAAVEAERRGAPRSVVADIEGALALLAAGPEIGTDSRELLQRGREVLERWQAWLTRPARR